MLDFQQQALRAETSIIAAIQDVFPFKGQVNTIIADKVWIEHEKGARSDFAGQKDKKIKGGTWAAPIYANLRLINNETGKVIDKGKKVRLVNLPISTPRGSYIVSGSEYQVPNQLRLLPGVYTRIQENGELESQVNLAKGMNFKIFIDPRTQVFQMKFGTATIQLYHVLTALGASRSQIEGIWGSEITEINAAKGSQDTEVSKLYKSIFRQEQPDAPTATADISTYFTGNVIDKATTKRTLGKAFSNVNPDMLLQISAKILAVSRGEKKADDRDSLEFKSIYSVDDFLRERIEKNAWKIKGSIRRNIDRKERIRDIIGISTFNRPIQSFFTLGDTGLSSTTEQTNPLHMISETDKIILTGAGGITNPYQVTLEARAVHPSSLGFIDPVATPESSRIGTTLHLPLGAEKKGNKLFTSVYEVKTGKVTQISSTDAAASVLSFRDQYVVRAGKLRPKSKTVKASNKGKISLVPASEVQYIIPTAYSLFSVQSNMIPFLPSNQGNRAMMAGKMMTQALPLQNREKPNVQVIAGKDMTFENIIGEQFSFKSPVTGTVESITDDIITIKDKQGKRHEVSVYGNFPLNSKTSFINSEAKVAVGDKVRKGQLLADTNYTRDGDLALGVNAHVAYLPFKGYNFEDGIVISEGFAKRLTSEHLYKLTLSVDPNTVMDLDKFRAYYPEAIDLAAASKLDKTGVIKKGQAVRLGDVVMAVLKKEEKSPEDIILAKLHRAFIKPYKNRSISWDEEDEGTVINIFRTPKKIEVHIRTLEPAKIGDKLAARHANKGTITHIANQNEMPTTKDGRVIDIMINPHSVPSRINPSQILETVAGKIAEKQGRQFEVRNFSGEDYTSTINTAMNKARVQDKEDLIDPTTNRTIPGVLVGSQYMLKLDHPTRKKFSARAQGPGYTIDLQPSRGKHTGGQRLDALTLYSMLAHGAKHNLREMATMKSEKNDEIWRALQLGQALPTPQTPFAFEKFVGMIKGLGVDVKKEGNDLVLMPMTDRQVRDASAGEIKNSQVVRGKDFRPETGGLFDPKITGGLQGDKWNHIELAEALPNPIFENAIKSILGITQTIYDDLIAGRRFVTKDGKMTLDEDGNLSGGEAVKKLLSKVNIDRKVSDLTKQAKNKKGADLDKIHKTIRYLTALKTYGMKPSDYVVKRVPVIPARLRPVYALSDGELDVTEVNYMYKDLIDINTQLKDFENLGMPDEEKAKLRETVYKGMKAVAGLHPHLGGRNYKGIIDQIKGNTNKEGFFQNRIMSRRQEFTGRSTIVPEPALGLDDVAIPEEMAWKTHQVFIVRELIRQGYKPIDAREQVEKRTPLAKRALEIALEDRPVMLNRAPSLHKFSIMAFKPQITSGKAIKINPLIVKGFNADFDGDTMAVHVPITEEARLEAWRMLPSRNLYSPRTNELMHTPTQEAITGLYLLTQTPQGRSRINSILPDKKYHITAPMTGKSMAALLKRISKESPGQFVKVVNAFKDFGNQSAYQMGFTTGLEDLIIDKTFRNKIFQEAERKVSKAKDKDKAIIEAYMEASGKLDDALKADKRLRANGFMIMANSGAKGNIAQIRQILAAPVLVRDIHNRTVPVPITKSYAEGLDTADYWATMSGARKGMIDRALQTSEPGALAKELLNTTVGHIISEEDCGTSQGIQLEIGSIDILDRYLASYAKGVGTRNTLITPASLKKAKMAGLKVLNVRSPLTCESAQGTCRKCFGIDERGKLPDIGTNIGVIAGQSIAEPATQLTMRTFHTGAAAEGGNVTAGFQRVKDLLNIPKILRGKATLAQEGGKIDDVKESPLGGWDIFINKNKHRVPQERSLVVKKGDELKKGDPLSDGTWHPEELVRLKGVRAAQDYLSNEIQREYLDQGVYIKRKIIESVVKPMTNTVRILDPGQHPTYIPGDHAPYNTVERWNRDKEDEFSRVIAEPMLRGINTAPLMSEDWIQRLNFQRLENTLLEGPSQAWRSPISSPYSPLSAYAYGSEIGKEE